jgi:hypothetical protein
MIQRPWREGWEDTAKPNLSGWSLTGHHSCSRICHIYKQTSDASALQYFLNLRGNTLESDSPVHEDQQEKLETLQPAIKRDIRI